MRVITVARRPLSEGSIASNTLAHGCGAVNIGGCRIATGDSLNGGAYAEDATPRAGEDMWSANRKGDTRVFQRGKEHAGEFVQPTGRWPANLVLVHLDGCYPTGGTHVVSSPRPYVAGTRTGGFGGAIGNPLGSVSVHYGAEDGTESVPEWHCVPGCPVAEVDAQSGVSSGVVRQPTGRPVYPTDGGAVEWNANSVTDDTVRGFADAGGASRFFKHVGCGREQP